MNYLDNFKARDIQDQVQLNPSQIVILVKLGLYPGKQIKGDASWRIQIWGEEDHIWMRDNAGELLTLYPQPWILNED